MAVHVVLGLLLYDPTLFTGGDNAGYMILGDALRTGRGYLDIYLPDAPLHTKYPPGYPAILALLGWIGGLQLFKLLSLACTAAVVWLVYLTGRRLFSPAVGVAAAIATAVNPVFLEYSHWVLSEAPFTGLVLLCLAAYAGRGSEGTSHPGEGKGWKVGVPAAVGAFLVRTAGLPLLAAVALHHALRREWRRFGVAAGAGGAAAGGWFLFGRLRPAGEHGYLSQLLQVNPYDPGAGTVGIGGLLERAAVNLWTYASEVLPGSLVGVQPDAGGSPEGWILFAGLLMTGLALAGWVVRARRGVGAAELFVLLYVGLICLWPTVWTDRRFLLPVLPLLVMYAVGAVAAAARRLAGAGKKGTSGKAPGYAVAGAAALLLAPALLAVADRAPERVRCLAAYRSDSPCVPAPWQSFYDAAEWARDNTPEEAVVANRKPRIFFWISRRPGDVYRFSGEPELVVESLERMGATHVALDRISGTTVRYLVPAVEAYRDRFTVVYQGGTPPSWILQYRGEEPVAVHEPARREGDR